MPMDTSRAGRPAGAKTADAVPEDPPETTYDPGLLASRRAVAQGGGVGMRDLELQNRPGAPGLSETDDGEEG